MSSKKVLPKSATVCLEGYKISKNGKCIKDVKYVKSSNKMPKSATVCLEGYKISKDGRCIKDKKYVSYVTSVKSGSVPFSPTVCVEGYKFSTVTGKCRKMRVIAPTVCVQGYKMTKDGRCIKDKAYSLVLSSLPAAVAPVMTPAEAKSEAVDTSYNEYVQERLSQEPEF